MSEDNMTRIVRKKRRQTVSTQHTESVECMHYEETKLSISSHKRFHCLLKVAKKEWKKINKKKQLFKIVEESTKIDQEEESLTEVKESKKFIKEQIKKLNKRAELPADLREVVERKGGHNVKLVITKIIYASDLSEKNSRFQIPISMIVRKSFLTKEEKEFLKRTHDINKDEKLKVGGMDVKILIEPNFEEHNLCLREWPMKKSSNYVLVSGWNSAIKNEKKSRVFKKGDMVQLWSFRCDLQLCFLLHKVRD